MTYKFETEDKIEANILMKASDYYNILFELKYNFWRKWKHEKPKNPQEVLDELDKALIDFTEEG